MPTNLKAETAAMAQVPLAGTSWFRVKFKDHRFQV